MILRSILLPMALGAALVSRASGSVDPEAEAEAPAVPQEAATEEAFAPYKAIIDRAIFGRPPPRPVAPPPPPADALDQKQAEALAKKITLCAINRTPSGNVAIGLIDNDAKPPRNIYLNVGDTSDGYTILAADYDDETATLEKDGVTITLKLGKGLVAEAPPVREDLRAAASTAAASADAQTAHAEIAAPARPQPSAPASYAPVVPADEAGRAVLGSRIATLRARIDAQRQMDEIRANAVIHAVAEEVLEARLREVNTRLLEQGISPIDGTELAPEE